MKKNGFTIVETMVAVAVLLIIIAAPLTLAERALASADAARQEITAVYLAQEAIEFVRNLRDTNTLAKVAWLTGLDACEDAAGCGIDPTAESPSNQIFVCNALLSTCTLQINKGDPTTNPFSGLYGHQRVGSDWVKTEYTRSVALVESADGKEAKVTVTVGWTAGGFGARTISVSTNLMHWYVAP